MHRNAKLATALARLEKHPILPAVGLLGSLSDLGFAALLLAVMLIEACVGVLLRCGIFAVEVLCAALDWAGAVY